jgi:hypothetical protein
MSVTPTTVGGTGKWQPQIRGLVHEKVRIGVEWMLETLLKFRADSQKVNANMLYSAAGGIGSGAPGNLQAPAQGKGGGPASQTAVTALEITIPSGPLKGQKGYVYIFQ